MLLPNRDERVQPVCKAGAVASVALARQPGHLLEFRKAITPSYRISKMKKIALVLFVATGCSRPGTSDAARLAAAVEVSPPGLHEESVTLDRRRGRLLLFGGIFADSAAPGGYTNLAATYEFDGERWSKGSTPTGPEPRSVATLEYDPVNRRVLLAGGIGRAIANASGAVQPCPSCPWIRALSDAWSHDNRGWQRRADIPAIAYPRLLFDSRRQQMLLLGNRADRLGIDGFFPTLLWRQQNDAWTLVDSTGPRTDSPLRPAFDEARGVMVLPVLSGPDVGVWEWSDRWSRITAAVMPSTRRRFVTAFDPTSQRVLLFGGSTTDGAQYFNDLWSWDGRVWSQITPDSAHAPSPRSDGTLLFHAASNRMLLVGGLGPNDRLHREMWALTSAGWKRLE